MKKLWLISKFVASQTTNNYNTHIPNLSRGVKFDQLIKYNMRNVFLSKIMQKIAGRVNNSSKESNARSLFVF